jgi:hypothetical protein
LASGVRVWEPAWDFHEQQKDRSGSWAARVSSFLEDACSGASLAYWASL